MGKDLHRSIRPFIEQCLGNHNKVRDIQRCETDDYYYYIIKRRQNLPDVVVALCDDYHVSSLTLYNLPEILNDGGFYLIAKPEATNYFKVEDELNLVIGKLNVLMGALNKANICSYTPPQD